jgi:hypothetical protein
MVEYIELIESHEDGFPIKLKLNTPAGEFIMDGNKITGYDYSKYRKQIFEGQLLDSRDFLKKKCLILPPEKTYEDLMNEDVLVEMILDKAISMIIDFHEKFSIEDSYIEVIDKHEIFKHITRLKVSVGKDSYVLVRKHLTGKDYQEQKKSMIEGTFERVNQNMIAKLLENKEEISFVGLMTKPFYYYKRLDNGKQLLIGDEKPF